MRKKKLGRASLQVRINRVWALLGVPRWTLRLLENKVGRTWPCRSCLCWGIHIAFSQKECAPENLKLEIGGKKCRR